MNKTGRYMNLLGKKFGRLTTIDLLDGKKTYDRIYRCICDCGNETHVRAYSLLNGHTKSCGCLQRESRYNDNTGFLHVLHFYKKNAEKRNLVWKLTDEQTKELMQGNCFYCSIPPARITKDPRNTFIWNGIDRVDNSRGYETGNCVTCCTKCNIKKNDMTVQTMIKILEFLGYKIIRTDDRI